MLSLCLRRLGLLVFAAAATPGVVRAADTALITPAAIQHELRSFATVGTVLHVAAHPDDENTQLITYLARGRGYRTAYLSITRGDGGQNEIGPEFDEKLGLARTQELLAARRLDGGRQFFTRAIDFGYSKNAEETLQFWDRDKVLADVVRVIRQFRPDVIVTRFSPGSSGSTHGHHTASAILALDAFKIAGDPKAYPEQLTEGLTPWQPKRILLNGGGGGRGGAVPSGPGVRMDIGGSDPVTGEGFGSIAGRSRGMHKTQGFGNNVGAGGGTGPNVQSFSLLAGEPAEKDIMDGIDLTWSRYPGGAELGRLANEAIGQFKPADLAASVPALLAIRAKLAALPTDPVIDDKRTQLDEILQACLGLTVRTTVANAEIVPAEKLTLDRTVSLRANVPVKLVGFNVGDFAKMSSGGSASTLKPGETRNSGSVTVVLPKTTPLSQPYWLQAPGAAGIFAVTDPKLIGRPENPPAVPVEYVFEVGGQTLVVPDEPLTAPVDGKIPRHLAVISPVALRFEADAALFGANAKKTVSVEVTAARDSVDGTVSLEIPAGWSSSPARQPFKLMKRGEKTRVEFEVAAPAQPTTGIVTAVATVDGAKFHNQRQTIAYEHIPVQVLQPAARLKTVVLNLAIRGKNIGYLPGAGDSVATYLEQMGYTVTSLTGADLTPEKLRPFGAVVIGVRAFNERTDLKENLPGLFAYAENGGTVIAQYNRPGRDLPSLAPYALSIAGSAPAQRVTDEKSPVSFLAPDHPALNVPNKITQADFDGWVQERGAYFPSSWDEQHFTPLLAMNDPGEAPLKSSILVARHGQGYFVYTGIGFFRQLPAGVPGAYRLFANLVSLGKE